MEINIEEDANAVKTGGGFADYLSAIKNGRIRKIFKLQPYPAAAISSENFLIAAGSGATEICCPGLV